MNWQQQNQAGIAWNQIYETMRMMWDVYHRTGDAAAKMAAERAEEQFSRMSGVINSESC